MTSNSSACADILASVDRGASLQEHTDLLSVRSSLLPTATLEKVTLDCAVCHVLHLTLDLRVGAHGHMFHCYHVMLQAFDEEKFVLSATSLSQKQHDTVMATGM